MPRIPHHPVRLCCLTLLLASLLPRPALAARSAPTTLETALDALRDIAGVNFAVDWTAIEAAGIARDTPVALSLRNVKLRTALSKTLDAAAPGLLTFYVDGNVVHVTTLAVADARVITRVYPVGDLLVDVPDFAGPDFNLQSQSGGSRSGGSGGGSGNGGSGSLIGNAAATAVTQGRTLAERGAALVALIQSTVRPEVWTVNGGTATIRYFHNNLIVTAPASVQALLD